jgi:glycosyltransferase involved in cell wall biosynthesis
MQTTIVLPVYNEEHQLEKSIKNLFGFLENRLDSYEVLIADNASNDKTGYVAKRLIKRYKNLKYKFIPVKGRGIALRTVWKESSAEILCYMDIDLSTDLNYLIEMLTQLKDYDIVTGSRLIRDSKVKRCLKREILSRGYNFIIRKIFTTKIKDMQCGFKGIRKEVFDKLEPLIIDNEFFFDTELLLIGEKKRYKIKEIPVLWVESDSTTVNIKKTVTSYLKNSFGLRKRLKNIN